MNKWEKILEPIDQNKKFWFKCVGGAIMILGVAVIINTKNTQSMNWVWCTCVCDVVIALSTAVLGSFLLNIIYNVSESRKISAISKVSYDNLLPTLLNSLEQFNGRYRENEAITVALHRYTEDKKKHFYKIILEYQYTTILSGLNELEFKFHRIFDDSVKDFTGGLNDQHMKCDFVWGVDERGFEANVIDDKDYSVSQLIIGNNQINNVEDYRHVTTNDSAKLAKRIISYRVPISELKNTDLNKPIQLSYCISLPLEREDVLLVTHELPTTNAKIIFDYSAVKDEINVYGMPVTGTISSFEIIEKDSKIRYVISGWVLPKQGYIFGWWKK